MSSSTVAAGTPANTGIQPNSGSGSGDRLGVPVRELRVAGGREQQVAPLLRERGERSLPTVELLGDLVTQQPAQPRCGQRQLTCVARWQRLPPEEVVKQPGKARGRSKFGSRGLDVSLEPLDRPHELAIAPQREVVAVGVEEVR